MRTIIGSIVFVVTASFSLLAQDTLKVDENALFSDTSSMVDSAKVVNTRAATEAVTETKSLGFSGEVNAYGTPSVNRAWFDNAKIGGVGFSSVIVGNGMIDARLKGGAKVFADLEASMAPEVQTTGPSGPVTSGGTQFYARELFLDANINHTVYLRAGKQVLQWGRCNLWNPTDLVNVERVTFIAKMGHREGTYGIKLHIPYKTLFNFYSFIDANNVTRLDSLAIAVKAEVLLGRTEMALSAWKRDSVMPAFGFDFSSRLFWDVLVAGEAALRNGKNMPSLDLSGAFPRLTTIGDSWFPRVALNLTRMLPLAGVPDRLMISAEGYYNQAGYDTNIFNDPRVRNLSNMSSFMAGATPVLSIYEPNSYSKYYASVFCSISQFIIDQLSLSCNALGNFKQKSVVLMTGLSYANLNNFTAGVSLIGAVGPEHTEYTTLYDGLSVRIQMGVTF
jgi:hypothetical protein